MPTSGQLSVSYSDCSLTVTRHNATAWGWKLKLNGIIVSPCIGCGSIGDPFCSYWTTSVSPNTQYIITTDQYNGAPDPTCQDALNITHMDNEPMTITTPGAQSTFTKANVYNGLDAIRITITSNNNYVDYWSIQRSNTQFGTYVEIAQLTPTGTKIYDDENIVLGNTYWYKIVTHATSTCSNPYTVSSATASQVAQTVVDNSCVVRTKASINNATSGDTTSRYELWRSATEHGTYQRVGVTFSGGTDIYDKIDTYGANYWYKVRQVTPNWDLTGTTETLYVDVLSMPLSQTLSGVVNSGTTSIDLSWTDGNTWKQQYEIWRRISGSSYVLLNTVTGTTYHDVIAMNVYYTYKIRSRIDCFAPIYIYSPYSNELTYSIAPYIKPPTGVTTSSITCTGGTLSWVNVNPTGVTGNYVKEFDGISGYTLIASLSSGSTTYNVTGLQPNTVHYYAIFAHNIAHEAKSQSVTLHTLDAAPFNLNAVITYTQASFTWSINDPPYGTAIVPELRLYGDTTWTSGTTLSKNATSYTFTGLTFNSHYEARFVRIGTQYPSIIYEFFTGIFLAPSGLTVTSIGDKQVCLQWKNNSINDDIDVYVRKEAQVWQLYTTVSNVTNSICVTGLSMLTLYTFVVINNYGSYTLSSNQVQATTTVSFIPAFCANESYTVIDTYCGQSTGIIQVPDDATIFYDFTLTDIQGNSYTITDDYWSGLTASWYKITAEVKPQWYFHYGQESCIIEWIPLYDVNTTIILLDTKIRNAICGGFGGDKGRIVYEFSDSGGTSWTFSLWNDRYQLVNTQSLTGITAIQYNSPADIYYGILENNYGCTYLIPLTQVLAEKLWTVEGIQRLFLTPWSASTSYDYYDNTSDDWYVAGIDTQQFTSTKIARYNNLSDFWYEIRLQTAVMTYGQSLQKGSNGLTYQETINISIPHADNAKWKQLVNVLSQRYIIVFQDNNGNWWTSFYRNGAEVKAYQLSENQYNITFQHPSVNKMLTAIDYAYVKLNIL